MVNLIISIGVFYINVRGNQRLYLFKHNWVPEIERPAPLKLITKTRSFRFLRNGLLPFVN